MHRFIVTYALGVFCHQQSDLRVTDSFDHYYFGETGTLCRGSERVLEEGDALLFPSYTQILGH